MQCMIRKSCDGCCLMCLVAVCAGNCGEKGRCVKPDVCRCHDGKDRSECLTLETMGESAEDYNDYTYDISNGWQSDQGIPLSFVDSQKKQEKEKATEKGYCYLNKERGICTNQVGLVGRSITDKEMTSRYADYYKMNVYECCNSVGLAWGGNGKCDSCDGLLEQLPVCRRGYKRSENGNCEDIDECELGVCQNGNCMNRIGSYSCLCPHGMIFNSTTLGCSYEKSKSKFRSQLRFSRSAICETSGQSCRPSGHCMEETSRFGKDYTCICSSGYELTHDRHSCKKTKSSPFNLCTIYKEKVCQNGQCAAIGTSYRCHCNEGFRASQDQKSCIRQFSVEFC
ncbi:Fibrillin-1 [Cichlidogyrus casuarinus]|uniref:Fibrillin-1 n=1 Tax=Cichlidogyrus casuarinus TaxID=1844966 RepID=A0ABD2Q6W1_9PLAT